MGLSDYYIDGHKLDLNKSISYYLDLNPEIKKEVFSRFPAIKLLKNVKLKNLAKMHPHQDEIQKDIDEIVNRVKAHGYTIRIMENE